MELQALLQLLYSTPWIVPHRGNKIQQIRYLAPWRGGPSRAEQTSESTSLPSNPRLYLSLATREESLHIPCARPRIPSEVVCHVF